VQRTALASRNGGDIGVIPGEFGRPKAGCFDPAEGTSIRRGQLPASNPRTPSAPRKKPPGRYAERLFLRLPARHRFRRYLCLILMRHG